jgi:hypothetical protein
VAKDAIAGPLCFERSVAYFGQPHCQAAIRQITVVFHQANTLCICISYCQGLDRALSFDEADFWREFVHTICTLITYIDGTKNHNFYAARPKALV